jgi:hypothetical protein
VESSFPPAAGQGDPQDYFDWRINVRSRGRRLLMLFLFSEVGSDDAPTRIRVGSHLRMARRLAPFGEGGRSLRELTTDPGGFDDSASCPQALATGGPGTVYLCHPFLVHAAQPHRGARVRFMAQPPLLPAGDPSLDLDGDAPVARAIREALRAELR